MILTIWHRWVSVPFARFIKKTNAGSKVLMATTLLALILANSPWQAAFDAFWNLKLSIAFGQWSLSKPLLLWVNDGLMSMFFFVVGLELKREMLVGELRHPEQLRLPLLAGLGGMLAPALIYTAFNLNGTAEIQHGWGIPMATDIAFSLGILHFLGKRVPVALKVFLVALAIIDDIGAVAVIAFFYTSEISTLNLGIGLFFLTVMILANFAGVRNAMFYGIIGIGGLWLAFLLSGVHATIAAVLAAFTIPANMPLSRDVYIYRTRALVRRFSKQSESNAPLVSEREEWLLNRIAKSSADTIPPLQRLEHGMQSLVSFLVIPVFALANAGVTFSAEMFSMFSQPVFLGIAGGLLLGKISGILGALWLGEKSGFLTIQKPLTILLFSV
jgi:NhaA family Na+:H+ antiporter